MSVSTRRPWWATALSLFCASALVFLVTRDLLVPDVRDTEVWLGLELHGWLAWLTAPLHWALFGVGAWGFWSLRPWVWPWASAYVLYVAVSHLVWNLTSASGGGWVAGLWQLAVFGALAVVLLGARPGGATGRHVASYPRAHGSGSRDPGRSPR